MASYHIGLLRIQAMLPEQITFVLHRAWESIQADPQAHLGYSWRSAIWKKLACVEVFLDQHTNHEPGWQIRCSLAVLCAEKSMRRWRNVRPNDLAGFTLLHQVLEFVSGRITENNLQESMLKVWSLAEDVVNRTDEPSAYAIFATAKAASVALYDEPLDLNSEEVQANEILDPYTWDCAFYAAAACSNGVPDDPRSDPDLRREFWRWYLFDAVAHAAAHPLC